MLALVYKMLSLKYFYIIASDWWEAGREAKRGGREAMERPLNINPGNFASRQIERRLFIDTGLSICTYELRICLLFSHSPIINSN